MIDRQDLTFTPCQLPARGLEVRPTDLGELHEQALRYFGGCPQYVVLDNLKEGVLKPDLYEPELNPVYAATLAHYGVVADPARVRDPNRKGTVEHAIGHTQATALKGRRFESIEAQNEFLAQWEKNWAAKRIHGTERRQVQAMFEEERAHLKALPLLGMQYFSEAERTVCDDSCAWIQSTPTITGGRFVSASVTVTVTGSFNPRPPLLAGDSGAESILFVCSDGFNPRPPLLAGDSCKTPTTSRYWMPFQSTPTITGGRFCETLVGGLPSDGVSIHAHHYWRAIPLAPRLMAHKGQSFNPRPPLLAGDSLEN